MPGLKPLIVFDIGNVLLRFDMGRAVRNFNRHGPAAGDKLRLALWKSPLGAHFEHGRYSGRQIYRKLKTRFGLRMSYADFCLAFSDIFTPVTENLELLEELAETYPVALLSNTNGIHWRYIHQHYAALRRARWPFSSHILGHMKPDPRIFRALSRRTGVPLERMVFVDDLLPNVRAARRLGMKAVLYTGRKPLRRLLAPLLNGNGRG
jgi:glucose-1-phosphatase